MQIHFVHPDGRRASLEGAAGLSLMQLATQNGIDAIVAECGGNAMCATCHVYVDEAWAEALPPLGDDEDALLDGAAADRLPTSRLACQIRLTPQLDGLVVRLPDRQT